jgi:hypothetical protein
VKRTGADSTPCNVKFSPMNFICRRRGRVNGTVFIEAVFLTRKRLLLTK